MRFVLSLIIVTTLFFGLVIILAELPQHREIWLISWLESAFGFAKSTDYWFKDKDDPEHKEVKT